MKSVEQLAFRLMKQFRLPEEYWEFRWNRSRRCLGLCVYPWLDLSNVLRRKGRIELSLPFCCINTIPDIEDTIRHEIAHALTGPLIGDSHGAPWVAMCKVTGGIDWNRQGSNSWVLAGKMWLVWKNTSQV